MCRIKLTDVFYFQVEVESSLEHPYFVYGQGWASCNPERTLQIYGLKVHHLQVGDILISLTPREQSTTSAAPLRSSTIITTATTTAMTVRPVCSAHSKEHMSTQQQLQPMVQRMPGHYSMCHITGTPPVSLGNHHVTNQNLNSHLSPNTSLSQNLNTSLMSQASMVHPPPAMSPDSLARKRRWSAPEQICDEDDQARRIKLE